MNIYLICKISLAIGLSLFILIISLGWLSIIGFPTPVVQADSLTVCSTGCVYTNIQAAVDAASDGDVIKVAAGTYTGVHQRLAPDASTVTQVVYISKSITIQGGYTHSNWIVADPETYPTIVDAQNQGRVIYVGTIDSPITCTISGLNITGGNNQEASIAGDGGGIYASIAVTTITDNKIFSNTAAGRGGGIFLFGSIGSLVDNTIASNKGDGGGLTLHSGIYTISHNSIMSNTGWFGGGGGVIEYSDVTFRDNTVINNTADSLGGGIFFGDSDVILDSNKVISNAVISSGYGGGGIYFFRSEGAWVNNIIARNKSSARGSGIVIEGSRAEIFHTTIADNVGDESGVFITVDHSPPFTQSIVSMTNTILVSHTVGVSVTVNNTATLEATLWGAGEWANQTDWEGVGNNIITGSVNLWGDPVFVFPDSGDYHIGESSAAKDEGIVSGITKDIDGDRRPFGLKNDLGADEFIPASFGPQAYLPIVVHQ